MEIPFYKYHGTGNDFILIDNRSKSVTGDFSAFFAAACHRRFGVGADGVILLNAHDAYDFEMDYFNSDGNRSSMCGNGGRCMVQFAHDLGLVTDRTRFIAIDGEHEAEIHPNAINLKMGIPRGFQALANGDFWIHTGSPHLVRFVDEDISKIDVVGIGRSIRYAEPWASQGGTNVNFVQRLGPENVAVRTYERGVEDETWSCGTGVTAVAEVMRLVTGKSNTRITLKTLGGDLFVSVAAEQAPWLKGPAKFVFQGTIDPQNHV